MAFVPNEEGIRRAAPAVTREWVRRAQAAIDEVSGGASGLSVDEKDRLRATLTAHQVEFSEEAVREWAPIVAGGQRLKLETP